MATEVGLFVLRAAGYLDGAGHSRAVPGYLDAPLSFSLFASCWKLGCFAWHFTSHALLATWARDAAGYLGAAAGYASAPLVPFPFVGCHLGCPASWPLRAAVCFGAVLKPHFSGLLLNICWDFPLLWAASYISIVWGLMPAFMRCWLSSLGMCPGGFSPIPLPGNDAFGAWGAPPV